MQCQHIPGYPFRILNPGEIPNRHDINVRVFFPERILCRLISGTGSVEHSPVNQHADIDLFFFPVVFADQPGGIRSILPFIDGNIGNIIIRTDILRNASQKYKFRMLRKPQIFLRGLPVIRRYCDHPIRILKEKTLKLHVLKFGVKMRIRYGYDIDIVLFQRIPDPSLVQFSPCSSGIMKHDRSTIFPIPDPLPLLFAQSNLIDRYCFLTKGPVLQHFN